MATPKKIIKGLQDLRTLSGNVDMVALPYQAYMKLSCLEMEKFRRNKERKSAVHRLENIDERFRQIEDEKDALLRTLGERGENNHPEADRFERKKSASNTKTAGFKIAY